MFRISKILCSGNENDSKRMQDDLFCKKAKKTIRDLTIATFRNRKKIESCNITEQTGFMYSEERCNQINKKETIRHAKLSQAYLDVLTYCKTEEREK